MSIRTSPARLACAALLTLAAAMIGCSDKDEDGDREESPGYLETLVIARNLATETACKVNLRDLHSAIRVYAVSDGKFPTSLFELAKSGVASLPAQKLHCPAGSKREYEYIPGQGPNMPGDNVLVYEAEPAHAGGCHVLRLAGSIEKLTPAELKAAIAETKRRIAEW